MTEFQINSNGTNQVSFEKVYHEKVLLKHFQGLYSNFDLTITPNSNSSIKLHSENKTAQQFLDHIASGIKKDIQIYAENNISICGVDIVTTNDKFHAVDSKPMTYQIPILEALNCIINRPDTIRSVCEPKLDTGLYRFDTSSAKKEYRNLEWDTLTTQRLIRYHTRTKYIIVNGEIKIDNNPIDIFLESKKSEYNTRTQNRIDLRFRKGEFSYEEMLSYLRIVELIVFDEYQNNINLSGFILYFERNEFKVEWRQEKKLLTLEWCIRNILKSDNLYIMKNEADR